MSVLGSIQYFEQLSSTHTFLWQQMQDKNLPPFYSVRADYQTDGRGQETNVWHSQKAKNILMSTVLYPPSIKAANAFLLSMWMSLRLCDCVQMFNIDNVSIKWPNDIYVGKNKIAGILIQNVINGDALLKTLISFGLNVNQLQFPETLPNPVSVLQKTGRTYALRLVAEQILYDMVQHFDDLQDASKLYVDYLQKLYGFNRWMYYRDSHAMFKAKIVGVEPWGHLVVEHPSGKQQSYDLKEIVFLHQE